MPTDDDPILSVAERAALGSVLEEHRPAILAMLRRRIDPALAGRLDADDVFAEVGRTACRRWADFQANPVVSPKVWLFRMARDRLIDAWRRHNRDRCDYHRDLPWPDDSSLQLGLGLIDRGTPPPVAAARAELRERVRFTLELLKADDRDILSMHQAEGHTFREAAEILGITETAATVRYCRALRRLRDVWLQLYGPGGSTP